MTSLSILNSITATSVFMESRSHGVAAAVLWRFFSPPPSPPVCSSTLPPPQSSSSRRLHPRSDIPRLRDSHFASLSSSPLQSNPSPTHSLFFPFEVWLSGDEKRLLVRPPPPPCARFITCLFDCISPFCCAWLPPLLSSPSFIYIEGRESEIERRSEELFKQNANGLLMDPHFFFFSSYSLFLFVALPGGWLAKCCIESDTGVRLCGETKPQLGATCPPPSYKVRLIYMEREGGLNPRVLVFLLMLCLAWKICSALTGI